MRVQIVKDALRSGTLEPNFGNGKDHVFLIITGRGKHSAGNAVLRPAIERWL